MRLSFLPLLTAYTDGYNNKYHKLKMVQESDAVIRHYFKQQQKRNHSIGLFMYFGLGMLGYLKVIVDYPLEWIDFLIAFFAGIIMVFFGLLVFYIQKIFLVIKINVAREVLPLKESLKYKILKLTKEDLYYFHNEDLYDKYTVNKVRNIIFDNSPDIQRILSNDHFSHEKEFNLSKEQDLQTVRYHEIRAELKDKIEINWTVPTGSCCYAGTLRGQCFHVFYGSSWKTLKLDVAVLSEAELHCVRYSEY